MKNIASENSSPDLISRWLPLLIGITCIKNILYANPELLEIRDALNVVVGLVYIFAFCKNLKSFSNRGIITFSFCFVLFYLAEFACFSRNFEYVKIPQLILFAYMVFCFAYAASDIEALLKRFIKISRLIIVVSCIIAFFMYSSAADYNMSYSKNAVFGLIMCLYGYVKYKSRVDLALSLLMLTNIVMLGARGPLLCVACFILIYEYKNVAALFNSGRLAKKKLTVCCAAVISIGFLLYFHEAVEKTFFNVYESLQFRSRTVELFLNHELSQLSGRDMVYTDALNLIDRNFLFGIGVEGGRNLIHEDYTPHNTYLEIMLIFGVPLALPIIGVLLYLWFSPFFSKAEGALKDLCLLLFCLYVPQSVFGAGIIYNTFFWMLLAFDIRFQQSLAKTHAGCLFFRAAGLKAKHARQHI